MPPWRYPLSLTSLVCSRPSLALSQHSRPWLRALHSTAIHASPRIEQVEVECRSSGHIILDILHPEIKRNGNNSKPLPPIIYLPSGFGFGFDRLNSQTNNTDFLPDPARTTERSQLDSPIISALSSSSGLPIVRINYRSLPYPLPVHDVLAGYDWVVENLCGSRTPIGVCGQFLGGSLAAMLAMTECQMGRTRIAAAALGNPIVDWPGLLYAAAAAASSSSTAPGSSSEHGAISSPSGPVSTPSRATSASSRAASAASRAASASARASSRPSRSRISSTSWSKFSKTSNPSGSDILNLRRSLFAHQDAYFDPFASPALFFRTPGVGFPDHDLGHNHDPQADSEDQSHLYKLELDSYSSSPSPSPPSISPSTFPSSPPSPSPSPSNPTSTPTSQTKQNSTSEGLDHPQDTSPLTKRRKSPRKYPPPGLSLQLPHLYVSVGAQHALRDQGIEFAHLVRRAVILQERKRRDVGATWFREGSHDIHDIDDNVDGHGHRIQDNYEVEGHGHRDRDHMQDGSQGNERGLNHPHRDSGGNESGNNVQTAGRIGKSKDEEVEDILRIRAAESIRLVESSGSGVWSGTGEQGQRGGNEGMEDMEKVGMWFRKILCS